MSLFDVLALVCGLCMVLKMPKRVYKVLGFALVVATLWTSVVAPTLSKARRMVSQASQPTVWTPEEIQALVVSEATLAGIDPAVALLVSELETNHRNVTGDSGRSHGPMQVQAQFHIPTGDPSDPRVSVRAGVGVLARQLDRYDGDIVKARTAYVCGSASGCSDGKRKRIETRLASAAPGYGLTL